ncbi:uncharacterized protein FA14DRAFT_159381 [Meira miltonrushii]|uniref:H+/nucleoside cotransporter n=1 Tax=Meira miltonrushii TaxID=1280837 RepID=A0A316VJK1_9BASI|nr:uncharacterized protein FA14DRAFT_159381 [Meira miltonrushii]PWN37238.1 hypothetical protein FA14DRAFT_159381 [Meira miltonrushii]
MNFDELAVLPQSGEKPTEKADHGSSSSHDGVDEKQTYHNQSIPSQEPARERINDIDIEAAKWRRRENGEDDDDSPNTPWKDKLLVFFHSRYAVWIRDFGLILLILGWWIPAIINDTPKVRHRWIPSTIFSWFFILLILFHKSRYIPQRPFARVFATAWNAVLGKPWSMLPYAGKLSAGWIALTALVFGSTYGLPTTPTSNYGNRTISLVGLLLIYGGMFLASSNHRAIKARTTILGIGFQFIIALFVFRTGAGSSFFTWISTAAFDLLNQGVIGGAAFFWNDLISEHYFFINTLSSIIFFVALCVALFYLGVLTWVIKKAAWFFHKTFDISGAEAVVAVASPFIGQGENVVLVRPYARLFTRAEFHQVLVSGFATIAGSVLSAYISIGVNGRDLITSSVMSIPASIAASKLVYPETQEAETAGQLSIEREEQEEERANDALHALSNGAWFGLRVAGLIFCNVLVIVSLVYAINGILAYIGNAWYITDDNGGPLSLDLIIGYILWPLTFMLGVPRKDVLTVSQLIATKVVQNEFVAYSQFIKIQQDLDPRAVKIVTYALCGFGNLGSLGINIGVMSAIAPKRKMEIVRLAPSALITGVFVTLSSAAIAGIVSAD